MSVIMSGDVNGWWRLDIQMSQWNLLATMSAVPATQSTNQNTPLLPISAVSTSETMTRSIQESCSGK